jgi:hypothetical protein
MYRTKVNSLEELPKDKRPPQDLWGKSYKLEQFIERVFSSDSKKPDSQFVDFDFEDVE